MPNPVEEIIALFPNAEQAENLINAVKLVGQNISARNDYEWVAMLNGSNYKTVMKKWFTANGCLAYADLSPLCDRWYTLTRTGWRGGVRFAIPGENETANSDGIKIGDNEQLQCVPSTVTDANRDDYANLPLFACLDCNVWLDTNGKPHISAIDGVAGNFLRYDPTKIVGVLQMTGWKRFVLDTDAGTYGWDYTDLIGIDGFQPLPEAVDLLDDNVRPWVVHGKYNFGDGWTCCSGQKVRVWDVSYESQRTGVRNAWSNRYCGATSADDAFMKLMLYLKYARLDTDRILVGCCNYDYTFQLAKAETGVKRILLTTNQAANLVLGSVICVGTTSSRGGKATNIDLLDRVKITAIETVEIDGTTYGAVTVDSDTTFDTTTSHYMYTYQWHTGSTDAVLGNDGGINPTSTKYPVKLQGIEYMVGCYEAMGDVILSYGIQDEANREIPYICRDASKLASSLTADYSAGRGIPTPESSGWQYPKQMYGSSTMPELIFPIDIGGSTSGGPRDGFYIQAETSGLREWLRFGGLSSGVGYAGLSCGYGDNGLSNAYWNIGGRLSVTGNRGEFQAAA